MKRRWWFKVFSVVLVIVAVGACFCIGDDGSSDVDWFADPNRFESLSDLFFHSIYNSPTFRWIPKHFPTPNLAFIHYMELCEKSPPAPSC